MKISRVITAKVLSPILFFFGDLCSKVMHWPGLSFMYVPYNWLMTRSLAVEDWAGIVVLWGYPPTSVDKIAESIIDSRAQATDRDP